MVSPRSTTLRRFDIWTGFFLLLGSLLLALVLFLLMAFFIWPAMYLLPVPAGGLLLGVWLIVRGAQPRWAKLLALSPVLGPLLLLLLIEAVTLLPPPHHQLVFLLPVGFRGQVTLTQNMLQMGPAPLVNGQLLLEIPRYGGHLDIREPLASSDLREAQYYVVAESGERLYPLPQLTEQAFASAGRGSQPGTKPINPRQVGIFPVGPPAPRPDAGLSPLRAFVGKLTTKPSHPVGQLQFTVACYDSLSIQRQWFK